MSWSKFAVVAALACAGLPAVAQAADPSLLYSPTVQPRLTAPSYFDGLYAGALAGLVSAQHGNFFTSGAPMRIETTGVVGYGTTVVPGIVVSGEGQVSLNTDFTQATDFDAMAYARLGFLSSPRFMTYLIGGGGYFANAAALEAGIGYEWMASGNLSLRLEGVGISQLGNVPSPNPNIPGISAVRLTSGAIWHFNGQPEAPYEGDNGPATDFSGAYAGLLFGAWENPSYNFFKDYGHGGHLSRVGYGVVAGWNYALDDMFRVGVEGQAGASFDSSGDVGVDALALARAGVVPVSGYMPYVAGGVGVLEGNATYAAGGGVEAALWGQNTVRVEALGLGELSSNPTTAGFSAAKLTLGTLFHFN